MPQKKFLLAAALSVILTGAGCSLTHTVNVNSSTGTLSNASANSSVAATVSYSGQTGKNALELLESGHQVDVSAQGFVNAIDGLKPGDHQYWSFYVNSKQADVGAKDYQTKSSDKIEWKLESF